MELANIGKESIINLVLGTGQCTIGTMNRKTCFLHFDIVILGVEIAKIGRLKIKNVLVPELSYKRPLERVRLTLFTCAAKYIKMRSTLKENSLLTLMQRNCNFDENSCKSNLNTGYRI